MKWDERTCFGGYDDGEHEEGETRAGHDADEHVVELAVATGHKEREQVDGERYGDADQADDEQDEYGVPKESTTLLLHSSFTNEISNLGK